MRRHILVSALALCCAAPIANAKPKPVTAPAEPPRVCVTEQDAFADAISSPDVTDQLLEVLTGDRASKLVDVLNHMGEPTSFTAKAMIARVIKDKPVSIMLFDDCFKGRINLSLDDFRHAVSMTLGQGT